MITIFTDGSSRGNPGPGGWGSIIVNEGKRVIELGGRENHTTNNRMELTAAINGLKNIPREDARSKITVNTDSSYVINGITKWVHGWKKKDWKTLDKKEVINRDLWEELDAVSSGKDISWNYVGGHRGVLGNERCDVIATSFADNDPVELFLGSLNQYSIPNIMDISTSPDISSKRSASKSRSNTPAYSYISMVDGIVSIDKTWKECEARVKGKRGARYKKALDKYEEHEIVEDFKKSL